MSKLPNSLFVNRAPYEYLNFFQNDLGSVANSLSWEKSCYDAVVQLRALSEDNCFTFANIISVLKQLDLSRQTERAQAPAKSTNVVREHEERQKCERDKNPATNNDLTTGTNVNDVSLTTRANNKDERIRMNGSEMQDEPMEIAEDDNRRKADVSIHDVIVKRTAFSVSPDTANKSTSQITGISSPSPINDPRFYVCTSFAASTPKTILPRCGTNLGSSFAASSIPASPSMSFESSQSFQYHDYCLSEGEFDITLPSQSSELAKVTARAKEAEIFRQIEGDDFDEKSFFNTQVPLKLDHLTANDDVVMLSML